MRIKKILTASALVTAGLIWIFSVFSVVAFWSFWDVSKYYNPSAKQLEEFKQNFVLRDEESIQNIEEYAMESLTEYIDRCYERTKEKGIAKWDWQALAGVKCEQIRRDLSAGDIDGWTALYAKNHTGVFPFSQIRSVTHNPCVIKTMYFLSIGLPTVVALAALLLARKRLKIAASNTVESE